MTTSRSSLVPSQQRTLMLGCSACLTICHSCSRVTDEMAREGKSTVAEMWVHAVVSTPSIAALPVSPEVATRRLVFRFCFLHRQSRY